jgi:hypothetical protein
MHFRYDREIRSIDFNKVFEHLGDTPAPCIWFPVQGSVIKIFEARDDFFSDKINSSQPSLNDGTPGELAKH